MAALRLIPALLFMGLLLLPLGFRLLGITVPIQLQENRILAVRPLAGNFFNQQQVDFIGYTSQLDKWFSDTFPTRPFWVSLHTQLLFSLFHESRELHLGKQNWLYYRSVIDAESPGLERVPPAARQQMVARMGKLSALLAERDITLYLMPLALKSRYYPEFLPASAQHARQFRFYDQYMDDLLAAGQVRVIDTRPLLEQAKRAGLKIFHQTDFHWTDPAGALVFKQLLQEIGLQASQPAAAASWQYDVVQEFGIRGGQSLALPLLFPLTEDSPRVELKGPLTSFNYHSNENGIEQSGIATAPTADLLPPILVYGDSFFDAADRGGFLRSFEGFARARLWNNDLTEAYKNRLPGTRYLVIEYITSAFLGIDNYVTALIAELEQDPAL